MGWYLVVLLAHPRELELVLVEQRGGVLAPGRMLPLLLDEGPQVLALVEPLGLRPGMASKVRSSTGSRYGRGWGAVCTTYSPRVGDVALDVELLGHLHRHFTGHVEVPRRPSLQLHCGQRHGALTRRGPDNTTDSSRVIV